MRLALTAEAAASPRAAPPVVVGLLTALPFLFPVTAGPSADVWQLLASWLCVALLALLGPWARPQGRLLLLLAAVAGCVALRRGPDAGPWLAACLAMGVLALAAGTGAGALRGEGGARAGVAPLAWGLWGAGVLSAAIGLLQYFQAAGWLVPWTQAPELGQAWGNLRQRNQFATLLSLALLASLWLYGAAGLQKRRLLMAGMALLAVAQAASTSRTGLLQLVAVLALAAAMGWHERSAGPLRAGVSHGRRAGPAAGVRPQLPAPAFLLGLLALYAASTWALPWLAGDVEDMVRRLREGAPAGHSRLLLWRNVLALIGQHPWLGWGWGALGWAHYVTPYAGPRFVEILDNAHNLPLHLAVSLGVPAALGLCGGFAALVLAARPWRERDPQRLLAWGLLAVLVLHSLLEYPLWYGPFQLAFGLALGLLWPGRPDIRQKGPLAPAPWATAAIVLIAMVGYAGWDYLRVSQIYRAPAQRLAPWREDTLAQLQSSWLFAGQVRFAELALTPVTAQTAAHVRQLSGQVLPFSPEPRVIARRIDASALLGDAQDARLHQERLRVAFPAEYLRWRAGLPIDAPPAPQ